MTEIETNKARQGRTLHMTRYVLVWGTVLALVGMGIAWYALA